MPNEPDPPPAGGSPLPVEARRRGGMDTLFSAAWFDEDQETASQAALPPRPPAAPKGPPDPLVIAIAVLSGVGVLGFSCLSVALVGIFAYLATLAV